MKSVQIAVGGVAVLALLGGALPGGCSQSAAPVAVTESAVAADPLVSLAPVDTPLNNGGGSTPELPARPAK